MKLALASLCLIACKYGGSDEDPSAGYEPMAPELVMLDAGRDAIPAMPPVARADAGTASLDGGRPAAMPVGKCEPSTPAAVCDPVRNTGCPPIPLMQCDADPAASEPTGRCAIFTPTPIVPCSSTTTAMSTACLPQSTCVQGQCRTLCYCDDDCADGETCSDSAGAFKLCR